MNNLNVKNIDYDMALMVYTISVYLFTFSYLSNYNPIFKIQKKKLSTYHKN